MGGLYRGAIEIASTLAKSTFVDCLAPADEGRLCKCGGDLSRPPTPTKQDTALVRRLGRRLFALWLPRYLRRDATAQGWILLSIDITSSFHRMAFDCDPPTDGVSITHFNSDVNTPISGDYPQIAVRPQCNCHLNLWVITEPIWASQRIVIFGIAVKSDSL